MENRHIHLNQESVILDIKAWRVHMVSIDGQLVDCLWFSLTEPEKAHIAYEVVDVIVKLSEVNLGVVGCFTLKHKVILDLPSKALDYLKGE